MTMCHYFEQIYYIFCCTTRKGGGGNTSLREGEGGALPIPLNKMGMAPAISLKKVELAPHPSKEASFQGGGGTGSNEYSK